MDWSSSSSSSSKSDDSEIEDILFDGEIEHMVMGSWLATIPSMRMTIPWSKILPMLYILLLGYMHGNLKFLSNILLNTF